MSAHVTVILDGEGHDPSPQHRDARGAYVAHCLCAWRSDVLPTRAAAVRSANFHRLNARIQEES
jgi:hypothetical protein